MTTVAELKKLLEQYPDDADVEVVHSSINYGYDGNVEVHTTWNAWGIPDKISLYCVDGVQVLRIGHIE